MLIDHFQIQWQRCARTDKGVHAAANIVSCKICQHLLHPVVLLVLIVLDMLSCSSSSLLLLLSLLLLVLLVLGTQHLMVDIPNFVESVNAALPEDIRLFGMT
jgi:tRNA U38,U39,U40 pseudouridine synthase TruA